MASVFRATGRAGQPSLLRVVAALDGSKLLVHLRALDERVQHVEHAVAAPGLGVLSQDRDLLLVVGLAGDILAVGAEAVELVDELVDDIPCPVDLLNISLPTVYAVSRAPSCHSQSAGPDRQVRPS